MQISKLKQARVKAHFPPSQKPGIKIASTNQNTAHLKEYHWSWAWFIPPHLCSHAHKVLTQPPWLVRTHRSWNPHQHPSLRDTPEGWGPWKAVEIPLSLPLIAFPALSFSGGNYWPHCSQIQHESKSIYIEGQKWLLHESSNIITWSQGQTWAFLLPVSRHPAVAPAEIVFSCHCSVILKCNKA